MKHQDWISVLQSAFPLGAQGIQTNFIFYRKERKKEGTSHFLFPLMWQIYIIWGLAKKRLEAHIRYSRTLRNIQKALHPLHVSEKGKELPERRQRGGRHLWKISMAGMRLAGWNTRFQEGDVLGLNYQEYLPHGHGYSSAFVILPYPPGRSTGQQLTWLLINQFIIFIENQEVKWTQMTNVQNPCIDAQDYLTTLLQHWKGPGLPHHPFSLPLTLARCSCDCQVLASLMPG